ncbi:MAG: DUF4089 domain-containing protein [Xenophilus sp.]
MTPQEAEPYVDAAAAVLGLPLRADHRPGVLRYFALAADFAAVVESVPLAPQQESAVSFSPVPPEEGPP